MVFRPSRLSHRIASCIGRPGLGVAGRVVTFADHHRVFHPPALRALATVIPRDTAHPKAKVVAPPATPVAPEGGAPSDDYLLFHPIYSEDELKNVQITHKEIKTMRDAVAFWIVRLMRFGFDTATGYTDKVGVMTETQWLNRIIFLETVAGVPGMVGSIIRHMRSLRLMRRDNGWIITLLEEAENERMHLLTAVKLRQAGPLFRTMVLLTQGVFFNAYFFAYLLSPKTCHKFVGYLEESAVHTYTHCLQDIEAGRIKHWATQPAPEIAISYWRLKPDATVKDVIASIRADESDHRDTNHLLAGLGKDDANPLTVKEAIEKK